MGASKELFEQIRQEVYETTKRAEDGDLLLLDALLYLREVKSYSENLLDAVKRFENENSNEIADEAQKYKGVYLGYEIKSVNGRKSYSYKGIEEIENIEIQKKSLEKKYQSAFEGIIKGVVQTTKIEEKFEYLDEEGNIKEGIREVKYWIDEDGELKKIPQLNIGKSHITVKEKRNK